MQPAPPEPSANRDPFVPTSTSDARNSSDAQTELGPPPQVTTKPGYQKSEGQLSILFTLVSLILAAVGFKYSPEKVHDAYEAIQTLIYIGAPLLASVPILKNYINSRGKVTSNAVWANAQLLNPAVSKEGISPAVAMGLMGGGSFGGGLGGILTSLGGGSGVKDPATWTGIAKIIGGIAGGKTGKIIGQVTGGSGSSGGSSTSDAEIEEAFKVIVTTLNTHADVLVAWWNSENAQQQANTLADVQKFIQQNMAAARSSNR